MLEQFTKPYGVVEKIDAFAALKYLEEHPEEPRKQGKVILVTAAPPLQASRGEGKTTTTIALIDALRKQGIDAAAVLRQPSMGITAAGSKGGASGGGKASLEHPEVVDWGLCGEMASIEVAQNLLVSFAEKAIDDGLLDTVTLPRVSEVPSRSLRQIAVDRGKDNVPERTVITPASEMMQIVILSRSMKEIGERVLRMVAGTKDGKPVTFGEFVEIWRITDMLTDAVKPALTHTLAGSPVYVHGGPFGNVSLGIPSLISVEYARARHDVVVVEAGYGADAGAQKYLDIACREFGAPWPAAAVVVTRATTWRDDPAIAWRYPFQVKRLEKLAIPTFPLINLWNGEDDEREQLRATAAELGLREPIMGNLFRDGGEGIASQLAALTGQLVQRFDQEAYSGESRKGIAVMENLRWLIKHAYGVPAERVLEKEGFAASLEAARQEAAALGTAIDEYPILAVKSPATMTDNDALPEAERTVTLKKAEIHAGAGLLHVNLTTSLTTPMPKIR